MIKDFYHFNGVRISDGLINTWIREVRDALESGQQKMAIASGDTQVYGFRWGQSIEINVANSSGRSQVNYRSDEAENTIFYYERPSK